MHRSERTLNEKRTKRLSWQIEALLEVAERPVAPADIQRVLGVTTTRFYQALCMLLEAGKIHEVMDTEPVPGTRLYRRRYTVTQRRPVMQPS